MADCIAYMDGVRMALVNGVGMGSMCRGDIIYVGRSWSRGYSFFFFSSRRRHTRFDCDWSSDVCSSDLGTGSRQSAAARSDTDPERSGEQREGGEIDTDAGQRENDGQSDQGSLDQLAEEQDRKSVV